MGNVYEQLLTYLAIFVKKYFSMEISSNIAVAIASIGSFLTATIALIISVRQIRVRKYEIKRAYYCEVLDWYSTSVKILVELRYLLQLGESEYKAKKDNLLSHLSSQIEIGRFYFPNIKANHGTEKPTAYQGIRSNVLDTLVFSFNLFCRKDAQKHVSSLEKLQREFTSIVFEILSPAKQVMEIYDITNTRYYKDRRIEYFLKNNPKNIKQILQ